MRILIQEFLERFFNIARNPAFYNSSTNRCDLHENVIVDVSLDKEVPLNLENNPDTDFRSSDLEL